jgi:hypothetical protein
MFMMALMLFVRCSFKSKRESKIPLNGCAF